MLWVDEPDWSDETGVILIGALANAFRNTGDITELATSVGIEAADIPTVGRPRAIWLELAMIAHEKTLLRRLVEEASRRVPGSDELRQVLMATVDPQVGGIGRPASKLHPEGAAAAEVPLARESARWQHGVASSTDTSWAAKAHRSPEGVDPPSRDMLQQRIATMSRRPYRSPEQPGDRPWRKVGSTQFADLVYALGVALPSVTLADDTASLSGVTRHLIRGGRDNPLQRWQAVLEQAIDDKADDAVCAEALKLTNSVELRAAVTSWIGAPDEM